MQTETKVAAHPAGEADFVFHTAGGPVALRTTGDALTPYGGLVPWAAFARHTGIVERLAATCPVTRTSPNAKPVGDILHSFLLTALVDGRPLRARRAPARGPDRDRALGPQKAWSATTPWQGPGAAGVWQVAEARVHLPGWTAGRRVVFARKLQGDTPALAQGPLLEASEARAGRYVTNLDLPRPTPGRCRRCIGNAPTPRTSSTS